MDRSSEAYVFMKRRSGKEMFTPFLMMLYREWVEEIAEARPGFTEQLRETAREAISLDDPVWIRKGLHALSIVGKGKDVSEIQGLTKHADANVAKDAVTCLFELRRRS